MKQLVKILVVVFSIIQSQWAVQVELKKGWNLFSPLIATATEAGTYFAGLGVDVNAQIIKIWAYDITVGWNSFEPGQGGFLLEPGKGYWVLLESDQSVTLPDTFGSFSMSVQGSGWHLVGANSSLAISLDESGLFAPGNFTSGTAADIQKIWSYSDNWYSYTNGANSNDLVSLESGLGFWFLVLSDFEVNSQNINLSDLFPPTCPGCPSIGN